MELCGSPCSVCMRPSSSSQHQCLFLKKVSVHYGVTVKTLWSLCSSCSHVCETTYKNRAAEKLQQLYSHFELITHTVHSSVSGLIILWTPCFRKFQRMVMRRGGICNYSTYTLFFCFVFLHIMSHLYFCVCSAIWKNLWAFCDSSYSRLHQRWKAKLTE